VATSSTLDISTILTLTKSVDRRVSQVLSKLGSQDIKSDNNNSFTRKISFEGKNVNFRVSTRIRGENGNVTEIDTESLKVNFEDVPDVMWALIRNTLALAIGFFNKKPIDPVKGVNSQNLTSDTYKVLRSADQLNKSTMQVETNLPKGDLIAFINDAEITLPREEGSDVEKPLVLTRKHFSASSKNMDVINKHKEHEAQLSEAKAKETGGDESKVAKPTSQENLDKSATSLKNQAKA